MYHPREFTTAKAACTAASHTESTNHPDTRATEKERRKQTLVVIGLRSRARMYFASRPLSFSSSFRGTVAACLRKRAPPRARPTIPAF